MNKLTEFLQRITGKDSSQRGDRTGKSGGPPLTTRAFVKTFNRCPVCNQDFVDHYFTLLSVIPTDKVAVTALIDKVKHHQWAAAREIREFDPAQDDIEIYVLRCAGRRLAVMIVEDPFEPYHNPTILDYEVLNEVQSDELSEVLGEAQWWSIK